MADTLTDAMFGMNPDIDTEVIQESVADVKILQGDGNSMPVQTDSSGQVASTPLQILGSIGSTARDLGTAVGTIKRDFKTAGAQYRNAENAASTGNSLSTWWQYASTTDKLMVGLAVVAIIVALKD